MQGFLCDLMAHSEWANAVFFNAWGDSPSRELEEMRQARRPYHRRSARVPVDSARREPRVTSDRRSAVFCRDQEPRGDHARRNSRVHSGARILKACHEPCKSRGFQSLLASSRSRSSRAGGHALPAPPRAVHDKAQGFRRSAAERGLDHLALEAEALGPVELTVQRVVPSTFLNYSGRLNSGRRGSSNSPSMRIGIVNDMALAREALRRVVLSSPANEVAWMAKDGAEAVALARVDAPDLILMDLFMPGTDGVEATRRIMGESPCAILVVTATIAGTSQQSLSGDGLRSARRDRYADLGAAG